MTKPVNLKIMKNQRSQNFARLFLSVTLVFTLAIMIASCKKDGETKNDNTGLQTLVTQADGYVTTAHEGNAPGTYVKGSLSTLQSKADIAKQTLNNSNATQSEITTATTNLQDAIYAFEANQIKDISLAFGATDSTFAQETSANSAVIFNRSNFTFEAWVIYSAKPGFFGQIASTEFYENGVRGWNLRIGDNDALDFTVIDGTESRLQPLTGATVPRNKWTHVACTFDGTTMKSYINGLLVGELNAADRDSIFLTGTMAKKQPLTFGNSAGFRQPERRLVGKLYDVRFWSVARTIQDIKANKDFILTGTEPNLVAYWPFIKSSPQTTIQDKTGKYNLLLKNGTVLGTRN